MRLMNMWPIHLVVVCVTALFITSPGFGGGHETSPHQGKVAIIGTGMVGGTLGPRFAELGYEVVYGSRNPSSDKVQSLIEKTAESASADTQSGAVDGADIIVLAVPWIAAEDVVRGFGDLRDTIIIDAVNPIKTVEGGRLEITAQTPSVGEQVQAWQPKAKVVKAFNTVGFHVMADPNRAGGPVTIPLASNHADAKSKVERIALDLGFETFDAGPLSQAAPLEAMTMLYMVPYMTGQMDQRFEFYLRPTPAN